MDDNNYIYLKKLLLNLGFGSVLNSVLRDALEKKYNSFSLGFEATHRSDEAKVFESLHKDMVKFKLNFTKSKTSEMVFLNDYQVDLYKPQEYEPRSHVFSLERDHRVTALQAYRLLSGFAVEKTVFVPRKTEQSEAERDSQSKKVWLKLNLNVLDAQQEHPLRKFHPEYGYDLAAALDKYPLNGLVSDGVREMALQELRRGNLFKAEMHLFDQQFPVYIAANPLSRGLDVFDKDLKQIPERQIFPEKLERLESAGLDASRGPAAEERVPWAAAPDQEESPRISR